MVECRCFLYDDTCLSHSIIGRVEHYYTGNYGLTLGRQQNMRKRVTIFMLAVILMATLTGCGKKAENSNTPVPVKEDNAVIPASETVEVEEKQPFIIYHISDDEIEMHFTSEKLTSIERLAFLAPTGDESGSYNTSVNIDFERDGNKICPFFIVFSEAMDVAYTIDSYGDEMEVTTEGNTLICHVKHENIILPFEKAELWHIDTENPQPFEGIITDDVSAIITPVAEGFLPDEFNRSEYDDQYFKPDSDDFVLLTYEIPIRLLLPEWYQYYGRVWHYGLYHSEKESNVKITYLISYKDDKYTSTKLRLEFASIDDAMVSPLVYDYDMIPLDLGLSDEPDDSLVTAEFFEDCDQKRYGALSDSDHDIMYHGHFDQFRYFEYKSHDTLQELKTLMSVPLTEYSDMLAFISVSSLSYSAGKTQTCELLEYSGNVPATTYSSKRTHEAGSDDMVLNTINDLPGDSKYFSPITDDYAYVLTQDYPNQGDGYFNQEVYLYSFDSNGKIVQCIYRRQYSEYLSDSFEGEEFSENFKRWMYDKESGAYYIDYLADYEGGELYSSENGTAKENLLFELTKRGQHEGFYFSKQ